MDKPSKPGRPRLRSSFEGIGLLGAAVLLVLPGTAAFADSESPDPAASVSASAESSEAASPAADGAARTPSPTEAPQAEVPSEAPSEAPSAESPVLEPSAAPESSAAPEATVEGTAGAGTASSSPEATDPAPSAAVADPAVPSPSDPSGSSAPPSPAVAASSDPAAQPTPSASALAPQLPSAAPVVSMSPFASPSVTLTGFTPSPAAALGGSSSAGTPYGSSSTAVMQPISRGAVLRRAQQWVLEGVPYSQSAWWTDALGTYRQDCSGYMSMAWHLDQRVNFWTGNLAVVSHPIQVSELQPGDILLSSGHTVLFAGWSNSAHTAFNMYEESHPGTRAHFVKGASYLYYAVGGFVPYRYNLIQDGGSLTEASSSEAGAGPLPSSAALPPGAVTVTSPLLAAGSVPATLPEPPAIAWTDGGGTVTGPDEATVTASTGDPGLVSAKSSSSDGTTVAMIGTACAAILTAGALRLLWRTRQGRPPARRRTPGA